MKVIKTFENDERLVRLIFDKSDKKHPYAVSILTRDGKSQDKAYKKVYYALRKFSEFKCCPLKTIGVK